MTSEFEITQEHRLFRDTVRKFFGHASDERAVRTAMASELGYDAGVWRRMAEDLGLHALGIPASYGGHGLGLVELCIVMEEAGRALLCSPYFSSAVLAVQALLLADDEAQRAALLPKLAAGAMVAALAVAEEAGSWDAAEIHARASQGPDGGWRLSGSKLFVVDGVAAEVLLVAARSPAGLSLFKLVPGQPGLARSAMWGLDQTRRLARIDLTDTPAEMVGVDGDGGRILEQLWNLACVAIAAEQLGGAQKCLEMSVEYAKVRKQFGRPIGSFQAIKHKCAEMLLDVESARSVVYYGAWCAGERPTELPRIAAIAKSHCSEIYFRTAAETIQIHGGIGFTWEHPAQLYFKRAKSTELLFGGPVQQRRRLAQAIGI